MKNVMFEDVKGRKRTRMIRDVDNIDDAATIGVPLDPPNVDDLDWEQIKTDLHNLLVDRGLISWAHVQESQNGLESVCKKVLLHRIKALYRRKT